MSDNRIHQTLARLQHAGRKALVPYVVAGDPDREATLPVLHALVAAGADIIELGVPFSDPMAEGPAIQRGHERALVHHTGLKDVLDVVRQFRQQDQQTPVVLMGYANPVERMGYEAFAQAAEAAGVDGLLTVDLPPEEAAEINPVLKQHNIETVFLIAPTTTEARIRAIAEQASGYLYYVSLKGVTGSGNLDVDAVTAKLGEIRQLSDLPVLVGFGIKDAASAKAVAAVSDGVIVGSVLVDTMGKLAAEGQGDPQTLSAAVTEILSAMREAIDQ